MKPVGIKYQTIFEEFQQELPAGKYASDQPYDPEDADLHAPCSQTCRNLLKDVESEALEKVLSRLVAHMIRTSRSASSATRSTPAAPSWSCAAGTAGC